MVKPDLFSIEFDRRGVYAPGDKVTGKVVVSSRDALIVDRLLVQFCGAARVFWSEKELVPRVLSDDEFDCDTSFYPQPNRPKPATPKKQASNRAVEMRSVAYANDKLYFDERKTLWQVENNGDEAEEEERVKQMYHHATQYRLKLHNIVSFEDDARIDAILDSAQKSIKQKPKTVFPLGQQIFDFEFTLPEELPTSFEGGPHSHCSIRYFVKAQLMHFSTVKYHRKEHFAVVQPLDLDQFPEYDRPVTIDGLVESTGTGGCRSQECSIRAAMHLQKRAYTPGDKLDVHLNIGNDWLYALKNVSLALVQKVECFAYNANTGRIDCKTDRTKLVRVVNPNKVRLRHGEHVWCPSLYVPAVTPTLSEDELISVEYSLEATINGKSKSNCLLQLTTPLLIGTMHANNIAAFNQPLPDQAVLPSYDQLVKDNDSIKTSDSWLKCPNVDTTNAPPPYDENGDLIDL